MASLSVEVDVDLDEFDTDEIITELLYRLKNEKSKTRERYKNELDDLKKLLRLPTGRSDVQIKTLDDQMKFDHFMKVFSKYASAQIEQLLPE